MITCKSFDIILGLYCLRYLCNLEVLKPVCWGSDSLTLASCATLGKLLILTLIRCLVYMLSNEHTLRQLLNELIQCLDNGKYSENLSYYSFPFRLLSFPLIKLSNLLPRDWLTPPVGCLYKMYLHA